MSFFTEIWKILPDLTKILLSAFIWGLLAISVLASIFTEATKPPHPTKEEMRKVKRNHFYILFWSSVFYSLIIEVSLLIQYASFYLLQNNVGLFNLIVLIILFVPLTGLLVLSTYALSWFAYHWIIKWSVNLADIVNYIIKEKKTRAEISSLLAERERDLHEKIIKENTEKENKVNNDTTSETSSNTHS